MGGLSELQTIDFQSRGAIAEAVLAQHASRKSRVDDPGSYRKTVGRYVEWSLRLFEVVMDQGRYLDRHEPVMDDAVYEEQHADFVDRAEVALEFGEDALKRVLELGLSGDEVRQLKEYVDHWMMELRDPDSFYGTEALAAFVEETKRAVEEDEFVEGAFGR